ncbi:hypothetical protein [Paraburkholderia sp. GAS334]|uniref:hypothetical protein n=1 Tax=Paraburkholderia sp. GAS334 TaxID=3035131 RepID=UPI003D208F8C
MHACNRLNALLATEPPSAKRPVGKAKPAGITRRKAMAFALSITGITAWRRLRNLLAQLPDSNDDFFLH